MDEVKQVRRQRRSGKKKKNSNSELYYSCFNSTSVHTPFALLLAECLVFLCAVDSFVLSFSPITRARSHVVVILTKLHYRLGSNFIFGPDSTSQQCSDLLAPGLFVISSLLSFFYQFFFSETD